MDTTRIVLADDHAIVRAYIRRILQKEASIEVVGEAANGQEALNLVSQLRPDILLLDMEMPVMNGVEVARHLRASRSPVRILALSAYDDQQYVLGLLANGASGYLTKDEAPDYIIEAVSSVARGERGWLSERIAARVANWIH